MQRGTAFGGPKPVTDPQANSCLFCWAPWRCQLYQLTSCDPLKRPVLGASLKVGSCDYRGLGLLKDMIRVCFGCCTLILLRFAQDPRIDNLMYSRHASSMDSTSGSCTLLFGSFFQVLRKSGDIPEKHCKWTPSCNLRSPVKSQKAKCRLTDGECFFFHLPFTSLASYVQDARVNG